MSLLQIWVISAMVLINAVFAAYELALASVSIHRLEQYAEQRRAGAKAAQRMKDRMEASLAVVQLGITFVGAIAAAVGGAGAHESIAPWMQGVWGLSEATAEIIALTLVVVPLAALTIVIGELVPKAFSLKHAEWVTLKLSPTMQVFAFAVYPVVVSFEWVTKRFVDLVERLLHGGKKPADVTDQTGMNELMANARALRVKRLISPEQERVIVGAGRLANMTVSDIMIPAEDIKMLNADGRLTEHLITVHLEAHTRFLVTERTGDPQGIIGYVNVKDLFFLAKTHPENPSVREILRPLIRVEGRLRINEALSRMMREHLHLALVRSEAGDVLGMITLEDVLEEVVGDIQDEFDRLPRGLTRAGRHWIAGGGVTLARIREAVGNAEFGDGTPGPTSLHDWIDRQGEPIAAGTAFEREGIRFLIRKVRRDKVMEVLIQPPAEIRAAAAPAEKAS